MTHDAIEQREMVDAYVRGRLTNEERQSFEEHFFACDRCFAEVREAQRMSEGVGWAVKAGLLPEVGATAESSSWWRMAFVFSGVAACLLMAVTGWYGLVERPRLQLEAAAAKQHSAELEALVERQKLAQVTTTATSSNLPMLMLEASRGVASNRLLIPAEAVVAALWMEVGTAKYAVYELEIRRAGGEVVERVGGLTKNAYGAIAASIPASKLGAGDYTARLSGLTGDRRTLVGEYKLEGTSMRMGVVLAPAVGAGLRAQMATTIESGGAVERELRAGEEHRYRFEASAGQLLRATLEVRR